ncbi:MAG TPA: aldo/keto reductase [Candidatus Acidoferrales bacterium]|nr:aldo/keto reductase [Candidatus Acidoferrales bacterium]
MKPAVSRIVLGTDWMIAVPNLASWNIAPTKRADTILNGAVELGINSFDTARMYWSEGVVGRFVRRHPLGRGAFRIISKGGHPRLFWKAPLTRKKLLRQLDDSLRALDTDYIDVYLLHYDDPRVPAQVIAEWSLELLRSGKAHNVGYSNISLARLKEFRAYLREANVVPWVSNEFNALPTKEGGRWKGAQNISRAGTYVEYLRENGLPFLAYSALGRGDLKRCIDRSSAERKPEDERRISRLISLGQKYGVPLPAIALNYILQTAPNFHAVVRTSRLDHLNENMRALTFQMSESDRDSLAFLSSSC